LGKGGGAAGISAAYSVEEHVAKAKGELRDIADEFFEYVSGLGDDVVASPVKLYVAFRTTRNFCCLEPHAKHLFLYLSLDPALGAGCDFCRDMRQIGHFGTGDLEVRVEHADQVAKAKEVLYGVAPQGVTYGWAPEVRPPSPLDPPAGGDAEYGFDRPASGSAPRTGDPTISDNQRLQRMAGGGPSGVAIALVMLGGLLLVGIVVYAFLAR